MRVDVSMKRGAHFVICCCRAFFSVTKSQTSEQQDVEYDTLTGRAIALFNKIRKTFRFSP